MFGTVLYGPCASKSGKKIALFLTCFFTMVIVAIWCVPFIPESYDARTEGIITPVKPDQGACMSCAAFSAVDLVETCFGKIGIQNINLSEQYVMDCAYNGISLTGCAGGNTYQYLNWIIENGGMLVSRNQIDYVGQKFSCPEKPPLPDQRGKVTHVWEDYQCDEEKLRYLVLKYGAVSTSIYASDPDFRLHKTGVFDKCRYN